MNLELSSQSYVIVSAVRNEGRHLEKTIDSVAGQSFPPKRWVIVDDGSTDNTPDLLYEAFRAFDWLSVVRRGDRGHRLQSTGVIEAFYEGYQCVSDENWNYLVKLDGDLSFHRDYFRHCMENFDKDPKLGIGGGVVCHETAQGLEEEKNPRFHVRGATKIYRRECWEAIGELIRAPGWDTLDEVKANMLGWTTRSFPELQVLHHRPTGSADGAWKNAVKNGRANYVSGYHPLFMTAKCFRRLFQPPYLLGAAGQAVGFLGGYLTRAKQISDPDLIRYLRRQQLNRLTRRPTIWY